MSEILVIDDDSDQLMVFSTVLIGLGYDVAIADSGEKGLKILESDLVDLVISDIAMPQLNGRELLAMLRKNQQTLSMPVILMSAAHNEHNFDHELDNYTSFVSKKSGIDMLIQKIKSVLH